MSRFYYICLLAFLWQANLQGQHPRMEHFGIEDGLPSTEVYQIFQDSKGYIWLGTDHGLARYNGYEFETFTTQDGLLDNTIFRIFEAPDGLLWFLPFSNGIFLYDGTRFFPHPHNDVIRAQTNTWVTDLAFSDNGDVWATYFNDRNSYKFLNVRLDQPIAVDTVQGFPNTEGYLVVGKMAGKKLLARSLTGVTLEYPLKYKFSNNFLFVKGIPRGPKRYFPIGQYLGDEFFISMGNEFGLIDEARYTRYPTFDAKRLARIMYDRQDRAWLASVDKGLIAWERGKGTLTTLKPNLTATDIIQDRDNNYWFSTTEEGIFKIPSIDFLSYGKQDGINTDRISHICTINDEIYFTTPESFVYKINTSGNIEDIRAFDINPKISKLVNKNGQLCIVAQNDQTILKYPDLSHGRTAAHLVGDTILLGTVNNLYIGIPDKEMVQLGRLNKRIIATIRDKKRRIWTGTLVGLYQFKDGAHFHMNMEDSIYKTRIADLVLHPTTDHLYIGSKGKGILVREKPGKPREITEEDGLNSNLIQCLFFENDSTLWAGSYQGLNCLHLDPANNYSVKNIDKYTTVDGLPSNEVNQIAKAQGKIWLATKKGLCTFSPSTLNKSTSTPLVQFTKIAINSKDTLLSDNYTLSYDQKNITIHYIGISTKGKVKYRYRMVGLDSSWQITENLDRPYTNLAAGVYTFELQAQNKNGIWSTDTKRIRFRIKQHYSQSTWFTTLSILSLFFVVSLVAYLVIQYNKLKSHRKNEVLISEQKALRSQMNPHFIFNAMNSIQYFIADNDKRNASIFLARFSSLIRKILDNSKHNFISLEEEISSIRSYLELEKLRFGEKFSYEINVAKNINRFEWEIPSMMLQPFLENAIWHGLMPKEGNGKLQLDFSLGQNSLVCNITDDGIGRAAAAQINKKRINHHSTGLKIVTERLHLLNSLLKTEMTIAFLDLKDEKGQAAGTQITINFPFLQEK